MVAFRKKNVAFLITVAFGSCVLVARATLWTGSERPSAGSAQSPADRTELGPSNAGFRSIPATGGSKPNAGSLFANDPNFAERPGDITGGRELFYKMVLSVLLVVALGAAAIYVSKKLLPKITNLPGKEIRIVETVHLGPRKAVHLIEIGDRRFLIGSTNESITRLADMTDTFTDLTAQEMNNN